MQTIIFDIDNTLCDISGIVHLLKEENWDAFHAASEFCPSKKHVADSARFAYDVGYVIILLTARTEDERAVTERWLANEGIQYHHLYMKIPSDHRSSAEYKRESLQFIRDHDFDVIAAWDDDPSVVAMYEEEGVPEVLLVPGYAEAAAILNPPK